MTPEKTIWTADDIVMKYLNLDATKKEKEYDEFMFRNRKIIKKN